MLFRTKVSNFFYIRDTYFMYSFLFTLLIVLLYQKLKNTFLHNTRILSCYLELYLSFLFYYLFQEFLQTPAPCGINIFISKLATNNLYTCSHQVRDQRSLWV